VLFEPTESVGRAELDACRSTEGYMEILSKTA